MSSYRDDDQPVYRRAGARPALISHLGNAGRIVLWGVLHFAFYLTQQIAELAAPVLLVLGAGWWALPKLLGMVGHSAATVDNGTPEAGQVHDLISNASHAVPASLTLGTHVFTPSGLIFDGILLMALAAACSTLAAIVAREI